MLTSGSHTHRMVVRMQVGHKHSSKVAQDAVYLLSIMAAQLSKSAFSTIQQHRLVRAAKDRNGLV